MRRDRGAGRRRTEPDRSGGVSERRASGQARDARRAAAGSPATWRQHVGPGVQVGPDVGGRGGPRRPDLDVAARGPVGDRAEGLRGGARDGAGLGAAEGAPLLERTRCSQDQPTSVSIGSWAMSSSTVPLAKLTTRNSPSHGSWPAGSCRSTKRPLAASSSSTTTSACSATAYGESRCGAGVSSRVISGRRHDARMLASAAAKDAGTPRAPAPSPWSRRRAVTGRG